MAARPTGSYPPPTGAVAMLGPVGPAELQDGPDIAPTSTAAEVLFSDVTWRPLTIVAWRRQHKGWAVLVRWLDGSEDWREHDDRYIRRRSDE